MVHEDILMNKIIQHCVKHGRLILSQLTKIGKNKSGTQRYACKLCRKEIMHNNFIKNKDKIIMRTKKWRDANRERYRELDRRYRANNEEKVRKWRITQGIRFRKKHYQALRIKQSIRRKMNVKQLSDQYLLYLILKGEKSTLKINDFEQDFFEVKRQLIILKRLIRVRQKEIK